MSPGRVARTRRASATAVARAAQLIARVAGTLVLILLVTGCGSGGDDETDQVVGPLPAGPDDPRAYTEDFLSHNPGALAQLEQLIMVHLEPTSEPDGDTCTQMEGVDCIPYVVNEPTRVELSIDDDVEELAETDLLDASGAVLLRHSRGLDANSVVVAPGSYVLQLQHLLPGERDAPVQTVFVRPEPSDDAEPAGNLTSRADTGSPTPATSPPTVRLAAEKDCIGCNFSGALLRDQSFDDLVLTRAIFDRARMEHTTFRGAKMADASFIDLLSIYGGADLRGLTWEMSNVDADFSGAVLSRTHWALRSIRVAGSHFAGVFRGAQLDGSVWGGKRRFADDNNVFFNADFRNADLTDSQWVEEAKLIKPTLKGRIPQCTFQGADLTRAKFPGNIKDTLLMCRFDKEPGSGRITTLHGANLTGVNVANTTMADADLTDAILDHTIMEGTTLTRADLSRATTPGVRWRGANLTEAVLTGISPPTLNDMDLTKTNFTGVEFAGLDLSHTDLSQAVLDAAPRLTGATLTDGTRGINLAGHRFPDRFALFKAADLTGVNLSHTELFQADLEGITLNNAQLVGANLSFANLRTAKMRGATLGVQPGSEGVAATLRGAFMPDIDLSDADLRTVDLTGAHLYGDQQQTLLVRTRLDSATLANAICTGAHFSGSMNNAVFIGAQLVNSVFNGATLTGAKFDDAYLQGADFASAIGVTGVVLSNAAVSAAPGTWSFTEVDGTPFSFRFEATKLGALATDRTVRCPSGSLGPCCPSGDLVACLSEKLKPVRNGPFPPVPPCVPKPPRYDNCITPAPTPTPTPAR